LGRGHDEEGDAAGWENSEGRDMGDKERVGGRDGMTSKEGNLNLKESWYPLMRKRTVLRVTFRRLTA
jgi:hypothetical protein